MLALGDKAKTVIRFIDEGSEVMLKITEYVIEFSPFGILSLIATMVSTISGAMMKEVLVFLITDNVICLLILILVYPLIIKLLAKLPPFGFMRELPRSSLRSRPLPPQPPSRCPSKSAKRISAFPRTSTASPCLWATRPV